MHISEVFKTPKIQSNFMSSKTTRSAILVLIIIAIGVFAMQKIMEFFVAGQGNIPGVDVAGLSQTLSSFRGLFSPIMYGTIILAIILIPVYIWQRRNEKAPPAPKGYYEMKPGPVEPEEETDYEEWRRKKMSERQAEEV